MLLEHKLKEMRLLLDIIRQGWNNKEIFKEKWVHKRDIVPSQKVNPGWGNILRMLNQCLERGPLSIGDNGPVPESVFGLIEEAEAVLAFFPGLEEEKPKEMMANPETIERCIQRIDNQFGHLQACSSRSVAKEIVRILQEEFSFVPK